LAHGGALHLRDQVGFKPLRAAATAIEAKSFFIRRIGTEGYRIGPKPKLNKVMSDRRASLDEQRDVKPACLRLVKEVFEQGAVLPVITFPEDAASIQDTPRLLLVIAEPATEWGLDGNVRKRIAEWTLRRGNSARLYPASLIWCVRKPGRDLVERVETWLAWQRVQRDLAEGVLGHDIEAEERQEVQAKAKGAQSAVKDAVWADYRFVVFADNAETDRLRVIDLGAGHSSSNETLSNRVLAALKSQGLLNETVGAGYILRKWPPALTESGAWPLSGLRQSFLDGSLTRLLDPDKVLRSKIVESIESGEFGLASGSLPNGKYQRLWFQEPVQPEEVTFDANVFLLRKETAERLTTPPPPEESVVSPTVVVIDGAKVDGVQSHAEGVLVIRLSGEVPPEQWNRLGTKLIPKLRATNNLRVEILLSGSAGAGSARALASELTQIVEELGLQAKLRVSCD
jgi:hypothetical protein